MTVAVRVRAAVALAFAVAATAALAGDDRGGEQRTLDARLAAVLEREGFTGRVESTLERRLGRPIDRQLADLGRLLWFDTLHSLRHDNTCGGCHSPTNGFGDSQSIAIGVQNNGVVGPQRSGPRNQRRSPLVINAAFLPRLMWNGRFAAPSGDPFDNALGFRFPPPEGDVRFPPGSPMIRHLLQAQAHIPPTEMVEVAGFTGVCRAVDLGRSSPFCQFDDGGGAVVPLPDATGFRNEPIRQRALESLNDADEYRRLFGRSFPAVAAGRPIDFTMFGLAIAEFEFTLTFADAPLDRFARGRHDAMTAAAKRGALLFFSKARCVGCHAVAGPANEMFTDARSHVAGVPQIAPAFGVGAGNVVFDGPGGDEDFGLEQITGAIADRYEIPDCAAPEPGGRGGVLPQRRVYPPRRGDCVSSRRVAGVAVLQRRRGRRRPLAAARPECPRAGAARSAAAVTGPPRSGAAPIWLRSSATACSTAELHPRTCARCCRERCRADRQCSRSLVVDDRGSRKSQVTSRTSHVSRKSLVARQP